jgi:hypothetical protein
MLENFASQARDSLFQSAKNAHEKGIFPALLRR